MRPAAVELIEQAQVALPVRRVAARIEEPPWLRVVGRRGPAGGFEEAQQGGFADRFGGEGAWRPALDELIVDGMFGNARISTHGEFLNEWKRWGATAAQTTVSYQP
ncbi:hypothetical protein D3C76_1302760 [compost metagenome]